MVRLLLPLLLFFFIFAFTVSIYSVEIVHTFGLEEYTIHRYRKQRHPAPIVFDVHCHIVCDGSMSTREGTIRRTKGSQLHKTFKPWNGLYHVNNVSNNNSNYSKRDHILFICLKIDCTSGAHLRADFTKYPTTTHTDMSKRVGFGLSSTRWALQIK